jgi:hypothetical protein
MEQNHPWEAWFVRWSRKSLPFMRTIYSVSLILHLFRAVVLIINKTYVRYPVCRSLLLAPVMNRMLPVHFLSTYAFKILINIILSFRPMNFERFLSSGMTKILYALHISRRPCVGILRKCMWTVSSYIGGNTKPIHYEKDWLLVYNRCLLWEIYEVHISSSWNNSEFSNFKADAT